MYIILIIYIIYIIQIILIIYNVYKLFISLFQRSKISSSTDPPHVCSDLIVTCYLLPLIVKIAPAQGCLVGSEQTCGTTLLLVVSCQLLGLRRRARQCAPLLKEKMFHGGLRFNRNRRPFALQSRRHRMPIAVSNVSRGVTADSDNAGTAPDRPLP